MPMRRLKISFLDRKEGTEARLSKAGSRDMVVGGKNTSSNGYSFQLLHVVRSVRHDSTGILPMSATSWVF